MKIREMSTSQSAHQEPMRSVQTLFQCCFFISCIFTAHLMAYLLHSFFIRLFLCGLIMVSATLELHNNYELRCFNKSLGQAGTLVHLHSSQRGFF